MNSLPRSYVIIVGLRYLHNHGCYNRFAIVSACLSLYCNILNHSLMGYITVKHFSMRVS